MRDVQLRPTVAGRRAALGLVFDSVALAVLVGLLVWGCVLVQVGPVLFIVTRDHGVHFGDLGLVACALPGILVVSRRFARHRRQLHKSR